MDFAQTILFEIWHMLVLSAPFLLVGLAAAGLVHVLLPTRVVERFLGRPGLRGAALAAGIGVPLPVCSCGVVPLAVEMKRKKASDPASLSFLVTTPESGVDSVLFTWALMGPVMAVARPVAAFATAMLGAGMAIVGLKESPPAPEPEAGGACCCSSGAGRGGENDAIAEDALSCDASIGSSCAMGSNASADEPAATSPWRHPWRDLLRPSLGYGFGRMLDDIAFWLVLGLALAGVLSAVLPADLAALGLGSGVLPMLVMLGIGVPLYICASASTPVAAALMAKGLAPGAALVFLLAGPATNAASLVILGRYFGTRFLRIYVASVALGALLCGLLLDAVLAFFGLSVALPTLMAGHEHTAAWELAAAGLLIALLVASAVRGSLRRGWAEMAEAFRALGRAALARTGRATG